jgi:hypothetical protein
MAIKLFLPVLLILALVFIGLGVGIFFSKKKKFPEGSISKNEDMQRLNITCAKHDELHACGKDGGCCGSDLH